MVSRYLILFFIVGITSFTHGQNWQVTNISEIDDLGIKDIEPQTYTLYSVEDNEIHRILWSAEQESTMDVYNSSTIISVGLPNNTIENFKIVRYEMMESELSAKYKDIRTFYGVSIINSSKRIRIDYTDHGFRAVISSPGEDKIFIDHFQRNDKNTRIVYFKKDYKKVPSWGCHVTDEHNLNIKTQSSGQRIGDCQLRSYRLAQATTGEYSNYHGATSSAQSSLVMTAVVNVINRINEVYEAEVAVRLILVNNTDQIFYYTPSTDPYTNNNGSTMLGQNISTCNSIIGSANYDIGHVFSTGGGGVAYLGSVCGSNKAGGVTGQSAPIGDPFSIDYVAHEMGHQFGGNHTQFNNCNRVNAAAMEPGSASTIMGYAGICSPNVQNNSDAYFHAKSIDEIKTFLSGNGNSCSTIISSPVNTAPSITSVPNYSIPISTPFVLTLTATDAQNHSMTYTWDQMNPYTTNQTMPPATTNTSGPMFRSILYTTTPSRYFPPLDNIISNTTDTWQVLPSVARSMSFRGVVRDFTGVFGCNNEVNITVSTVNAAAGAFSITSFNTTNTWNVGDSKTITWNVAGSTASPVSAANVDILFSTDGGNTFPITLASATPNDGTQSIVVPNNTTTQGRIMVRGTNHIFYDINNANITISGVPSTYTLTATPSTFNVCPQTSLVSTINVVPTGGFSSPVTLSVSGLPAGANANFSTNPVTPGSSSIVTLTGLTTSGNYTININGIGGSQSKTTPLNVTIQPLPSLVNQLLPTNQAMNVSLTPTMTWSALSGSSSYNFEVAYDQDFTEMIATYNGTGTSYQINNPIFGGTTLYWRVKANNSCGTGSWSERSFTVEPCYFYNPDMLPLDIPNGATSVYSYLNIPDKGVVTDINILNLVGSYPEISALQFSMINPQNTSVLFWNLPCSKENSFNIQFDDSATGTWPCPPVTGMFYAPSNPLSILNNQSLKGTWALKVDRNITASGEISNWGIKACANNYCRLEVSHNRKDGPGSLKHAVACASQEDTITFDESINNDTIFLGDQNLFINKHLNIISELSKNIHIMSESNAATIQNSAPNVGKGLTIKGLHIHSSNTGIGAIENNGNLTLEDVVLHKWEGPATSTIVNQSGASVLLKGECKIIE